MQTGIGLPANIPGVKSSLILDWARQADAGPFSSLGIIDRLIYPNYEPLITLAAAAGVTQRIRLITTVLVAPLRPAGVLAKQVASLDALSDGRLTLGLGIGGREDDYLAAPASFHDRAQRFEEQLAVMRRIWSGQPLSTEVGRVGPLPMQAGGPEVLIGGYSPPAARRAGRWGDGFISGGGSDAPTARQFYEIAEEAWRAEGRAGRFRFVAASYYALGPDAANKAAAYIRDYYAFMGPATENRANAIPSSLEAVQGVIQAFTNAGADELILWPCIPELDQIDRLADLVG